MLIVPVLKEKGRAREEIGANCARAQGKRAGREEIGANCARAQGKRASAG